MENKYKLLNELNTLTLDDLTDIRRALAESFKYLENAMKNVRILNDEIFYIFRQSEINRQENFVKVGVYSVRKYNKDMLMYHIVSDSNYVYQEEININWKLINQYEIEVNKPIRINRFVIDIEYWLLNNTNISNN